MNVITIDNLSKKYIIGHQRQDRYQTLRDTLGHKIRSLGQRIFHPLAPNREEVKLEEIWALKDINLEIKQGERLGIIGRNGAGKSTLLKVLSRITEPTTGRVRLKGRIASLLEVGTGFHAELTGQENIYLNGAILGMTGREIKRKFDDIVAFAEVEKFLDTPVKRYSSGMYVRLAFAVAAHLDPEILLVDEVLAVGDYRFQEKCMGKMRDLTGKGRTILFVSHNMKAISQLCTRAIWLSNGHIQSNGDAEMVIRQYTGGEQQDIPKVVWDMKNAPGNHTVRLLGVQIENKEGRVKSKFDYTEPVNICVTFLVLDNKVSLYLRMYLDNEEGINVLVTTAINKSQFDRGVYEARYTILPHFLNEGRYFIQQILFKEGSITSSEDIARVDYPVSFNIDYSSKFTGGLIRKHSGVVRPDWDWDISEKKNEIIR